MYSSFFRPFTHFYLDDAWVDSVAARGKNFFRNFLHQLTIPIFESVLALV